MKKIVRLIAALALTGSFHAALAGDVTGKVTLNGTSPPETEVDFSNNPECGSLVNDLPKSRRFVVGKDHGLKDVFVYISKGLEGKTFPTPSEPVVLDQAGCMYQPYVMGLMVGQKLQVKDSDPNPVIHSVHTDPNVAGNDPTNITQTAQGQVNVLTFAKPEIMLKIKCDVHLWMLCYVGVVDNPYFAVTDADGQFKIPNLPPGEYTLTAYHVKSHAGSPGISQTIKVEGGKAVAANFTVDVAGAK